MQTVPGAAPVPGAAGYVAYIEQLRLAILELQAAIDNDDAFATTITGLLSDRVAKTGNESIDGTKTFLDPLVVPTATDDTHAVNRGQVRLMQGSVIRGAGTDGWKATDTSRASTITPTIDPDLQLAVPASAVGKRCQVLIRAVTSGLAAADIRHYVALPANNFLTADVEALTLTGGSTSGTRVGMVVHKVAGATTTTEFSHGVLPLNAGDPVTSLNYVIDFRPTATGTVGLYWAQDVSNSTGTVVHAGSEISLYVEGA